jgi:hypothetical protein
MRVLDSGTPALPLRPDGLAQGWLRHAPLFSLRGFRPTCQRLLWHTVYHQASAPQPPSPLDMALITRRLIGSIATPLVLHPRLNGEG